MPIPQVNDRIKEAPAVMLRAVFAGVGQLLLAADKVRARAAGTGWPPDRTTGKGQSRWHTLDDTRGSTVPLARERAISHGHSAVRLPTASPGSDTAGRDATQTHAAATPSAEPAGEPATAAQAGPAAPGEPSVSTEPPVGSEPPVSSEPPVGSEPTPDAPPLPGYDDLSLPSLRAKLRVLDATTLEALLGYEKAHAKRDDVITMFERRLAKIKPD
jgi:hypothetical protein